jgi:hypothetical protein
MLRACLSTGAYIYAYDDLTTGSSHFRYALLVLPHLFVILRTRPDHNHRRYRHGQRLGAQLQRDGAGAERPLCPDGPSNSPALNAVTSIVALHVIQDLRSVTPTARTMTISSMVAHWFTDQPAVMGENRGRENWVRRKLGSDCPLFLMPSWSVPNFLCPAASGLPMNVGSDSPTGSGASK